MFGDKRGSVLVDMGLARTAPDSRYKYLVVTGPRTKACDKQGMPDTDEIPVLEEILGLTSNFITGVTAKVLAGTFTSNCERLNYYYVKDTTGVRNAVARAYNRSFGNYSYVITMRPDPDWLSYRTFLYPSEQTQDWMMYNRVTSELKQHGDSLKAIRKVKFDLYFGADTARAKFVKSIAGKGYVVEREFAIKNEATPYGIIVSKESDLRRPVVDSMVRTLRVEAVKQGGYLDMWDAAVKVSAGK